MGVNRKRRSITHRDVARLANVSTAVVSYVINNGPRPTSPEVRKRVLMAIEELDYQPNAFARGLRAQRADTIGFVVNSYYPLEVFASPYSSGILTGLAAGLHQRGYYLLIDPMRIGADPLPLKRLLRSRRLDGIVVRLIEDPPASDSLMELIAAAEIPCVCIERRCDSRFNFKSVTSDDVAGAYRATRYLLDQGHRRIGHLCGDPRYAAARDRLEGYRRAILDAGMVVDEQLIQGNTWDTTAAAAATRQLMASAGAPTAIFAANDSLAVCALDVLRAAGKRAPHDVAVIGFDDIPIASQTTPRLTTVHVPLPEIGRRAADLILRVIEGADGAASETLPVDLVLRETA